MKAKSPNRAPSRPVLPPPPVADSDRLVRGLPMESGESQPQPPPRTRLH